MNDFVFQNSTKVYFGQNQLKHLHEEVLRFGDKVLVAYGGEFIKQSPLYREVIDELTQHGIQFFETGCKSNPILVIQRLIVV